MIASLASDRVAAPDYSVYAATKAAQLRLTEGLRLELAEDRGIRVSLVKPGFMNTAGIGTGTRDPERQKQVLELKERIGLPPAVVAEEIRHLLALPAEVTVPRADDRPDRPALGREGSGTTPATNDRLFANGDPPWHDPAHGFPGWSGDRWRRDERPVRDSH